MIASGDCTADAVKAFLVLSDTIILIERGGALDRWLLYALATANFIDAGI